MVVDATVNSEAQTQAEIDVIAQWADDNGAPISIDKCGILIISRTQQQRNYFIRGTAIKHVESFTDLGVTRSQNAIYAGHYSNVIAKAAKATGVIRRAFRSRCKELMWPAFMHYVLPGLMYASQAWNPYLRINIDGIERIQRRFTKIIHGMNEMPYANRMNELQTLSLENRRTYMDLITVYKLIHNLLSCNMSDVGIELTQSITRANGCRLKQPLVVNRVHSQLFSSRVPPIWNKLPLHIVNCNSVSTFKRHIFKHLLSAQHD